MQHFWLIKYEDAKILKSLKSKMFSGQQKQSNYA